MNINKNGEVRECKRCGKMFFYAGTGKCICSSCKAEDESEFNIVKEYIYDNFSATILEVSRETGVRVARIKSYLKDGRLIIPDGSSIFLNCEVCGTNIKFGRLCRECAGSLSNEMKREMNINEFQIGEKPNNSNLGKMRFLDDK